MTHWADSECFDDECPVRFNCDKFVHSRWPAPNPTRVDALCMDYEPEEER